MAEFGRDPSKFAEVDIKQAIEDINPQLWRMICTLTKQSTDVLQAGREAEHYLAKSHAAMLISARSDGTCCSPTMQLSTAFYAQ